MKAYEIIIAIKHKIRFQQSNKEKDSHYTILGDNLVRISNHCARTEVLKNFLLKYPEHKNKKIISIVFDDTDKCLCHTQPKYKPEMLTEHIYKSSTIQKNDIEAFIKYFKEIDNAQR